ncbi:NAD-dependent malic enzyme [Kosakonia radicincitans DSM 16656]|uniref:malate dehydrogenase (oxaloacetate-decarboxylating) n=1 Tax=Kosakonia radicincitans TaxID=283686 RepID=A0AAX2EQH2_9ENTR|nr:NAD-dependent malic enzyme [Kosakonia radicincitans]MDP9566100.1 malate dehydrogenase (oxaloacetate-decarboxylating) [Kosakonia oryzae]ARD59498.1 NAD-dependent malic enzyme [Kosakonia radicincitans DSM 16656]KDE35059.1 malate dehydrogenase [Kosakonia radicincitans UMEnt01/12]MDD7996490.1 NAD-dependent malic enzyme [Kosakonia radicincitans]SFE15941.1 malate dehydrogenase (oxaloacetate-decarboxylating) [Kosakonia radicincitans]
MLRKETLYTPYNGAVLLENPLLNKGLAFTEDERLAFNLYGLLPHNVETIEEQTARAWQQFCHFKKDISRHVYLRNIQDTNETLFYNLLRCHMQETLPIIYTPTVGEACEHFSEIYRRARGLFISWPDRHRIDEMLQSFSRNDIRVIVVTDGERILGLGDQGIGGMGIPIGKLSLYTACGGIDPASTLPIMLDVGTNNSQHLENPLYMGWRHPRISDGDYIEFMDMFVEAIKARWPNVLLQFEDFAQKNATKLLNRYRHQLCCFNDDIQGTAAVTTGTLIAASQAAGMRLRDLRVVFLGSGSAGCGIAEKIIALMVDDGLTPEEARNNIFMIDRFGLLTDDMPNLLDFQQKLVTPRRLIADWDTDSENMSLLDVVRNVHPNVLIGVSGQPGLFSEEIVKEMHRHCSRPIIMPLSNPTSRAEAQPRDLIEWTQGAALIATGSPFEPVFYQDESYEIAQCNNAYIFPGLGLGVLAGKLTRVTDTMLSVASKTLAAFSPLANTEKGGLLPPVDIIETVSKAIALQVAQAGQQEGVGPLMSEEELTTRLENIYWDARYKAYKRASF